VAAVPPIIPPANHHESVHPEDAGPQWGQIVAAEDGTTVKIVPTVSLPGGPNVAAAPANAVTSYTLSAGQFIQWAPGRGGMDMSGSVFESDKPVGFYGGTGYLCLDSATSNIAGGCESAHQRIPPVSALGWQYAVVPYATRLASMHPESIRYRFVGAVNDTKLT